ncbi:MAG: hypothetical protein LBV07_05995 [Syntrophobacterales bacterium]|jgi:hypothetical protein|nr:hypothetical protein [Syntrophobacterales bacterium]
MAKYDDASWHYDGDYPEDLPAENASTHIGMFLAWCINNDLISEELQEDSEEEIDDVKSRKMTGGEFLRQVCDEKFSDYDLNETGNEFAEDYYEDETAFSENYKGYFDDYAEIFNTTGHDFYKLPDSWENYDLITPRINQRFREWKEFRLKK